MLGSPKNQIPQLDLLVEADGNQGISCWGTTINGCFWICAMVNTNWPLLCCNLVIIVTTSSILWNILKHIKRRSISFWNVAAEHVYFWCQSLFNAFAELIEWSAHLSKVFSLNTNIIDVFFVVLGYCILSCRYNVLYLCNTVL